MHTKPVAPAIKLHAETKAARKSDGCFVYFSQPVGAFRRCRLFQTAPLFFLSAASGSCSSLSTRSGRLSQVNSLSFHCLPPPYTLLPLISSCFAPPLASPDIARCAEGMQLLEEFHPHPPRSHFHSHRLTQTPFTPTPHISLFSISFPQIA